jgi:hypothetical protein
MERLQLSLSLAEKEAQAFHKEAEIIRIKMKMLENKEDSESPPTPPVAPQPLPVESPKAPKAPKKKTCHRWKCDIFTSEDVAKIDPYLCHRRSCAWKKNEDKVRRFYQHKSKATEKHGYCQKCQDKTAADISNGKVMEVHSGSPSRDGDIRLWGGTPSQVVGVIYDNSHKNWIQQLVCDHFSEDDELHYVVAVPDNIRKKYNLPDAPFRPIM